MFNMYIFFSNLDTFFQYTKTVCFNILNTINKTLYMDFFYSCREFELLNWAKSAHLDLLNKLALFLWCSSTMQALFSIVPVVIQLIFFMRWRALTHELSSTFVKNYLLITITTWCCYLTFDIILVLSSLKQWSSNLL